MTHHATAVFPFTPRLLRMQAGHLHSLLCQVAVWACGTTKAALLAPSTAEAGLRGNVLRDTYIRCEAADTPGNSSQEVEGGAASQRVICAAIKE